MENRSDKSLSGISVLLVEDEVLIGIAIQGSMHDHCADRVELTTSLEEAKNTVRTRGFDVAILDVNLRDGDTFDLARQLMSDGTRVIFHSGNKPTNEQLLEFPEAKYCQKPCDPEELIETVLKATQVKRQAL